jgi:CRP-like cAMP-binding protein
MTEILTKILQQFGVLQDDSLELFKSKTVFKELSKGADIFTEGKGNSSEYILLSGVAHRYNLSEKGDVVTTGFYMPRSVITPHFARTVSGKSIFSLQALTDISIAEIAVKELDALRHSHDEFRAFGQRVVEAELAQTFFAEVVFRSYSAKERLLTLRTQFPNLENLVPHHVIASYLGITNVSFSRLRKELAK